MKDSQNVIGTAPEEAGKEEPMKRGMVRKIFAAIFFLFFLFIILGAFMKRFGG